MRLIAHGLRQKDVRDLAQDAVPVKKAYDGSRQEHVREVKRRKTSVLRPKLFFGQSKHVLGERSNVAGACEPDEYMFKQTSMRE